MARILIKGKIYDSSRDVASLLKNLNDICVVYDEGLKKLGFSATALLPFRFSEKRNEILPSIAYHWDFCGRNFNIIKAKCEKK